MESNKGKSYMMKPSFIFSLVLSAFVTYFISKHFTPTTHDQIISISGPIGAFSAMLFGFVIASISIFSGASNNSFIRKMKANNMLSPLMQDMNNTGIFLILSCIFSIISMFTPFKIFILVNVSYDYFLLLASLFFIILSMILFFSIWRKIRLIIEHM